MTSTAYALLALSSLALAIGCSSTGQVDLGHDKELLATCDTSACGPALGMPTTTCADGSTAGPTGRCIKTADGGACGWEVRDCPPPVSGTCDASACGASPGVASTKCDDGSYAGPTGACIKGSDGKCTWEIRTCSGGGTTCKTSDCPAAVPAIACADGTTNFQCVRGSAGTCTWSLDCPAECTKAECGPMPGAPACTCSDGSIGCNTGKCQRDASGKCGWEYRTCP